MNNGGRPSQEDGCGAIAPYMRTLVFCHRPFVTCGGRASPNTPGGRVGRWGVGGTGVPPLCLVKAKEHIVASGGSLSLVAA